MQKWFDYWNPSPLKLKVYIFGCKRKIQLWKRLQRRLSRVSLFGYLFVFLFTFSNCNPPAPTLNPVESIGYFDLSRQLTNSNYQGFHFDEAIDLSYHWKKNAGRYSLLPRDKRWQNTQMTFLKDSSVLHNHSLDSIMLTPNSKLEIPIKKCKGILKFRYGALGKNSGEISGTLHLSSGEKKIGDISINNEDREKWKEFNIKADFDDKITYTWDSNSTFLFLGTPEFKREDYSQVGYNVILIVIDSLRRDALGCNGQKISTSPNIDLLCKEGISFKNHFSNANWTKPSMISMLTGEYTSNLGITNTGFPIYPREKEVYYNGKIKSLPEILRSTGYYTASIMNNVFLLDYTGVGVDMGFHELHQIGKDIEDTEAITKEALNFLKNPPLQPFFLHLNYNTPHGSYSPPEHSIWEIKKESNNKDLSTIHPIILRYLGEVRYTDEQIGILIAQLKKNDLYDKSMIIITSDHGDLFDERHTFSQNGIYGSRWGHGETHYDEEIAIPLVIKLPRTIKNYLEKKSFYSSSSSISLVPTILGFLGLEEKIHSNLKGTDYSNIILENKEPLTETSVYTEGRLSESIRNAKFKYIRHYPGFTNYLLNGAIPPAEKLEELYDLKKDPNEYNNVFGKDEALRKEALLERKNFVLRKNSFFVYLPAGHNYDGSFQFQGGIYDYSPREDKDISIRIGNRFNLNFSGKVNTNTTLQFMVNEPEFKYDFSIRRDGLPVNYRVGAWGLLQKGEVGKEPGFLFSREAPESMKNSKLPYLYSDEALSGRNEKSSNGILAEEVKSILKSWGYIHE